MLSLPNASHSWATCRDGTLVLHNFRIKEDVNYNMEFMF